MERDVVGAIRKEVARRGGWVFKVHGSAMQERGIPDLVGCLKCPACSFARFFAIEAKRPDAKPRPDEAAQRLVHRLIAAAKGAVSVISGLREAVAFFDHVQRSEPVCAITPELQFQVTPERVLKAKQVFVNAKARLSETQVLAICTEVGLNDLLRYNEAGTKLELNLTDLQLVSVAAAIAAAVEGGAQQVDHSMLDEI